MPRFCSPAAPALSPLFSHIVSILAFIARPKRRDAGTLAMPAASEGVSILRPVCGIENFIEETLLLDLCARLPAL